MFALTNSKGMFYQSVKFRKSVFYCILACRIYIIKQIKKLKPYIKTRAVENNREM